LPYRCPRGGGIFGLEGELPFDRSLVEPSLPGIWRYRHTFGLDEDAPVVSLGEGNTPLVWDRAFGQEVAYKLEFLNPSGSFKDRGTAPLISFLCSRGAAAALEDSSGNAGASFAAYAARAGLRARVFVPEYASGPKLRQIQAYGAEVVLTPGPRSNTAAAALQAAEAGIASGEAAYGSHVYLPFTLPGYATVAYELVEQIGASPGTVIVPAGQGSLILGIERGFAALKASGWIERTPALVGVQARACAPLWAVSQYGVTGLGFVTEGETLAEGVRIKNPLRGDEVIRRVEASGGGFISVDEDEILPARDELAGRGFYVEPTSAIAWAALKQAAREVDGPVVLVLTGSGLKGSS
jgi:threonine synthase